MSVTLAISTCALDPKAGEGSSSGAKPYKQRAFVLKNFILPAAIADDFIDEVIVVGSWETGTGYTYLPKPSINFNCTDTLHQRQHAFEHSHGDIVIFMHDDHLLDLTCNGARFNLAGYMRTHEIDVLIPARYTRLRKVEGERLNSGEPGMWRGGVADNDAVTQMCTDVQALGYIPGHCAAYTRKVIEACPWGDVEQVFHWDTMHTKRIMDAGFRCAHTTLARVFDVEQGSTPWV